MNAPFFRIRNALLWLAVPVLLGGLSRAGWAGDTDRLFEPYQALLTQHLVERILPDGGLVSAFHYRSALAAGKTLEQLEEQRRRLAGFDTDLLETREQSLAFWINAYNFFMIDYILRHPDDGRAPSSVRDYGSFFNPYRVFKRRIFEVHGQAYSLEEIELDVLLGERFAERGWKDARVHFMINCASVGCPPLRRWVYTADNIEAMLAENTRTALDSPLHMARDGDTLKVTSLFDWYESDFVEQSGSVEAFIREHGSRRASDWLQATGRIEFIDYDWSLNSPENFEPLLDEIGIDGFE